MPSWHKISVPAGTFLFFKSEQLSAQTNRHRMHSRNSMRKRIIDNSTEQAARVRTRGVRFHSAQGMGITEPTLRAYAFRIVYYRLRNLNGLPSMAKSHFVTIHWQALLAIDGQVATLDYRWPGRNSLPPTTAHVITIDRQAAACYCRLPRPSFALSITTSQLFTTDGQRAARHLMAVGRLPLKCHASRRVPRESPRPCVTQTQAHDVRCQESHPATA